MGRPKVKINVKQGALGRTLATDDGVAAMVLTGIAATSLGLNVAKKISNLSDAVAAGITLATHPHAYGQILDFYGQTGPGAELWIMLISEATTTPNVFTPLIGPMDKLLKAAKGRITIAGNSMGRAGGYSPTPTGILDFNLGTVGASVQSLAQAYADRFQPVAIIVDGCQMINPLTGITSMRGAGDRVGCFVGAAEPAKKAASMGRFLGRLAAIPVHQSIARVKTGAFCPEGYLTSGLSISDDSYSVSVPDDLHEAGYMTLCEYSGVFGAYVQDDQTLAAADSDFVSLANRRVMDKAIRIAYATYANEINENVTVTEEGKLSPSTVSYIEDVIIRQLNTNMLAKGNCSAVDCYVDADQNILSSSELQIQLEVTPVGYLKSIVINLGFKNPALA
jgi:hypothetical protein